MSGYFDRWVELSKIERSYEGLRQLMIIEQVMRTSCTELRLFIQERSPHDLAEVSRLGEQYIEVHGKLRDQWGFKQTKFDNSVPKGKVKNASPVDTPTKQVSAKDIRHDGNEFSFEKISFLIKADH